MEDNKEVKEGSRTMMNMDGNIMPEAEVETRKERRARERKSEDRKEMTEDRSAYNCPDCKGEGLQDANTICPKCHGTGKI